MKPSSFAFLLILLFVSLGYGQSNNYRCEVQILDYNFDKIIPVGDFIINSEVDEEIIKSFKLPETKLFVVVYYNKNNPKAKDGGRTLMLIVSKKPYKAIEEMSANTVVTNSISDSSESNEKTILQTLYLGKQRQSALISLECGK